MRWGREYGDEGGGELVAMVVMVEVVVVVVWRGLDPANGSVSFQIFLFQILKLCKSYNID